MGVVPVTPERIREKGPTESEERERETSPEDHGFQGDLLCQEDRGSILPL